MNREEIIRICNQYNIKNWTLNEDGTIDVDGHVEIYGEKITKLPLKFGRVTGCFWCYNNGLTSLEGSPNYVGGAFNCESNKLTTLEGSPKKVEGAFNCSLNKLTSLEGAPDFIGGDFYHDTFTESDYISYIRPIIRDKKLTELGI